MRKWLNLLRSHPYSAFNCVIWLLALVVTVWFWLYDCSILNHAAPVFLSAIVIVPALLQNSVNARRKLMIAEMAEALDGVAFVRDAISSLERRMVIPERWTAILIFGLFCYFYFLLVFMGTSFGPFDHYIRTPNLILGGFFIENPGVREYQMGTVFCGTVAFVMTYLIAIFSITSSVNMNAASPFTYWFGLVAVILAPMLAGLLRHVSVYFVPDTTNHTALLALIGIAAALLSYHGIAAVLNFIWHLCYGIAPTGFMPSRNSVDPSQIPDEMPLIMIDGMTDQVRCKFNEIGIDSCLLLALANPVLVWVMTHYNLRQICDWIGQAMLVVYVRPSGRKRLAELAIRDIFGLIEYMKANKGQEEGGSLIGWDPLHQQKLLDSLLMDPQIKRLIEFRSALLRS